jgi:hypothetical protein
VCGHAIHLKCARAQYRVASTQGKIVYPKCGFPGCCALPEHALLRSEFVRWSDIRVQVERLTEEVIVAEDLAAEPDHVLNPKSEYFRNPLLFARDKLAFYMCSLCRHPFYGGHVVCDDDEAGPRECLCNKCDHKTCVKHGDKGMVYKCHWCCRPALFRCRATQYACEACHGAWNALQTVGARPCMGGCQFPGHPPNGTDERFGYCALCANDSNA